MICFREQDDKFVTAITAQDSHMADYLAAAVNDLDQHLISGRVAVPVIDLLEQVNIEHDP
jgi:hypothetical protein